MAWLDRSCFGPKGCVVKTQRSQGPCLEGASGVHRTSSCWASGAMVVRAPSHVHKSFVSRVSDHGLGRQRAFLFQVEVDCPKMVEFPLFLIILPPPVLWTRMFIDEMKSTITTLAAWLLHRDARPISHSTEEMPVV